MSDILLRKLTMVLSAVNDLLISWNFQEKNDVIFDGLM